MKFMCIQKPVHVSLWSSSSLKLWIKSLSTDDWVNKTMVHPYYGILCLKIKWTTNKHNTNFKCIMLSKSSQTNNNNNNNKKATYCMILFIWHSGKYTTSIGEHITGSCEFRLGEGLTKKGQKGGSFQWWSLPHCGCSCDYTTMCIYQNS